MKITFKVIVVGICKFAWNLQPFWFTKICGPH